MTKHTAKLRGKDRRYLRGLGNSLRPTVYLGKEGLSAAVIRSLNEAYANSELVKVRCERNIPLDRREAGEQLAAATESHLVASLGQHPAPLPPRPRRPPNRAARIEAQAFVEKRDQLAYTYF